MQSLTLRGGKTLFKENSQFQSGITHPTHASGMGRPRAHDACDGENMPAWHGNRARLRRTQNP
jgi:hypothetical protein